MPILENPVSSETGLDQQDEEFLRELTSYDYAANNPTEKMDPSFTDFDGRPLLFFITSTTPIALPRQGTWLTTPDPRPQIESTLNWVPD